MDVATILDLYPAYHLDEGIALEGKAAAICKLHPPRKLTVRCGVDVARQSLTSFPPICSMRVSPLKGTQRPSESCTRPASSPSDAVWMWSQLLDLVPADLLDEGIALEGNVAAIGKLHLPRKLAVRCGVDVETTLDLFPADLLDEGIALEGNPAAIGKLHPPQKLAVRCGVDVATILDLYPAYHLDEGIALKGNERPSESCTRPASSPSRCGVDVATTLDLVPADLLDEGIALEGNPAAIGKLHPPRSSPSGAVWMSPQSLTSFPPIISMRVSPLKGT